MFEDWRESRDRLVIDYKRKSKDVRSTLTQTYVTLPYRRDFPLSLTSLFCINYECYVRLSRSSFLQYTGSSSIVCVHTIPLSPLTFSIPAISISLSPFHTHHRIPTPLLSVSEAHPQHSSLPISSTSLPISLSP